MKKIKREQILEKYLSENNEFEFKTQQKIGCYRVDFLLNIIINNKKYIIIIECDEWNHCDKSIYDEFKRMICIREKLYIPVIFIRLSSDVQYFFRKRIQYKFNTKVFIERINHMMFILRNFKNSTVIFNELNIIYLYYSKIKPFIIHKFPYKNMNMIFSKLKKKSMFYGINEKDKFIDICKKNNLNKKHAECIFSQTIL